MSKGTLVKNPLENAKGLSPKDEQEAVRNFGTAKQTADDLKHSKEIYNQGYTDGEFTYAFPGIVTAVSHGLKILKNRKAQTVAAKHYKRHKDKFQAQAVKDAAAEGVHTDFGSESRE